MKIDPDRAHVERLCLRRIADDGGWCTRIDEHKHDECAGYPSKEPATRNTFGPEAAARSWG